MFREEQTPDLPETLQQEILHNSRDMKKFYTLNQQERDNVLDRISLHNSPEEIKNEIKKNR